MIGQQAANQAICHQIFPFDPKVSSWCNHVAPQHAVESAVALQCKVLKMRCHVSLLPKFFSGMSVKKLKKLIA